MSLSRWLHAVDCDWAFYLRSFNRLTESEHYVQDQAKSALCSSLRPKRYFDRGDLDEESA